jgi:hypothetical protein
MKHMTYDEVLAILNQAVAERGADWIYPGHVDCGACRDQKPCDWHCEEGCRYFTYDKQPCCIVGYFIDKVIDTSHLDLSVIEGQFAGVALKKLEDWEELSVDDRTKALLIQVQANQDSYKTWGDSLNLVVAEGI